MSNYDEIFNELIALRVPEKRARDMIDDSIYSCIVAICVSYGVSNNELAGLTPYVLEDMPKTGRYRIERWGENGRKKAVVYDPSEEDAAIIVHYITEWVF